MSTADDWWHSLSDKRRDQLYRWFSESGKAIHSHPPTKGQRALFDELSHEGTDA